MNPESLLDIARFQLNERYEIAAKRRVVHQLLGRARKHSG